MRRLLLDKKARAQIVDIEFYSAIIFTLLMKFLLSPFFRKVRDRLLHCSPVLFYRVKWLGSCSLPAEDSIIIKYELLLLSNSFRKYFIALFKKTSSLMTEVSFAICAQKTL